jgi:hypothetical protein
MSVLNKKLSTKEALEYIAFAAWYRDLPDNWDGEITCEWTEDGEVEIIATPAEEEEHSEKYVQKSDTGPDGKLLN